MREGYHAFLNWNIWMNSSSRKIYFACLTYYYHPRYVFTIFWCSSPNREIHLEIIKRQTKCKIRSLYPKVCLEKLCVLCAWARDRLNNVFESVKARWWLRGRYIQVYLKKHVPKHNVLTPVYSPSNYIRRWDYYKNKPIASSHEPNRRKLRILGDVLTFTRFLVQEYYRWISNHVT